MLKSASEAEGRDDMRGVACNLPFREADRTRLRTHHAGHGIDERGLARAVGTDDAVNLAGRHRQRDLGHGGNATETNGKRGDLKERHRTAPWLMVLSIGVFQAVRRYRPGPLAEIVACRAG